MVTVTRSKTSELPAMSPSGGRRRGAAQRAAAAVRSGIRALHAFALNRPVGPRVAIYLHQLEPVQWGAFRECMSHFIALGYRTVSAPLFVAPGDDRRLFVSFDDNFRDWHRALPLFEDLGITATFYVNTLPFRDVADRAVISAYLGRLAMAGEHETLTRSELREIHAAGHSIGCHSHSHVNLARLPRADWDSEIRRSKDILESLLGSRITDFAWPYGMRRYFTPALRNYCVGIGFETITNAISGCQAIAADDPLNIYRTDWRLDRDLSHNLANLAIDARLYARLTGRSAIG